uniref:LysR family transcriptional regulator n=1 Tax=Ralstonia solanacearum TaxID=305 RepID=A0A0S4TVD0_RALSL
MANSGRLTTKLEPLGLVDAGEIDLAVLIRPPFIRYDRRSFGGRRVDQFLRD